MHGGESERSAAEFRGLNRDQQQAVMTFLESLVAPPAEGDVAVR